MIITPIPKITKQKATGSHFTPTELATVIARRLLAEVDENSEFLSVLDPACGDGELLLAMARESKNKLKIIGVEADLDSIESADRRMKENNIPNTTLIKGDFLELVNHEENLSLFQNEILLDPVDLIIANPPYVRTQILGAEKAQKLAKKFNLSGRVDLYQIFLVAMTLQLKPGGLLGVITSNRYLSTTGGKSIREFLDNNYEIIQIMDLGDTKLFDAAVLPAIFFGRKKVDSGIKKVGQTPRFFRIYEETNIKESNQVTPVSSIYEILERKESGTFLTDGKYYTVSVGNIIIPKNHKGPWPMATDEELNWVKRIEDKMKYRVKDIGKVRVGIKTTADNVFIKSDWDKLPEDLQPEKGLLRPLFSSEIASRWQPLEKIPSQRVLYPHTVEEGKRKAIDLEKYPRTAAYLNTHREQLEGREYVLKAKRKWYEIWVPQDPLAWTSPKIVFPDISPEPKFFVDLEGCIVDGNCYWIIPEKEFSEDMLFLITAVSNTRLMTKYHDIMFQNKLYAGRRRYFTQYVEEYPIPDPDSDYAKKLVSLAKELILKENSPNKVIEIEEQIEVYTSLAFNVEPCIE
ncbi:N-6 DNA methylase [Aneurinibacillus thermoaerophilus]|uniref:Eco57I restriction-modification methylase domain-containing protein n=2 Tax=Aneurinibacillus thermoaerophilus TaxID=143495 RepID=UPI002E1C20F9|nr:N-6 DNA methylase [Aneurinibacillus thermoaerophilus]MED0680423.1 N-6 DNA methylase [Aneurinibacillus thermoaerophilus]